MSLVCEQQKNEQSYVEKHKEDAKFGLRKKYGFFPH